MSPKQLTHLLYARVIPWLAPNYARIITAKSAIRLIDLPEGVTLSSHKITGQREIVKDNRKHGNQRLHIARWPDDNLHELSVAKVSCVIDGNADLLVSRYCLHCNPGTFILIPAHLPHQRFGPFMQQHRSTQEWCTTLHAYAHSQGVLLWLNRSSTSQHINDKKENYLIPCISAARILDFAVEEATEATRFDLVGGGLLAAFFAIIAQQIEMGKYVHPGPKEELVSYRPSGDFGDQVQKYMEANCHKTLRLEDAATHMFMSSSTFSRQMHKEMGMTYIELLTQIRIERAKHMLRETDLTVAYIAGSLSFKSSTQFHKLFKRHLGCSPVEYRNTATTIRINDKIK